jgi:nucleotide-binding universal stress UspA family protein
MIVIPMHGLTGTEHLLPGNATENVVGLAQCPAFTEKTFGSSLLSL